MPIMFDEVDAEVTAPAQGQGSDTAAAAAAPATIGDGDAAEVLREKLQLWAQRERRLEAD